MKNMLLSRDQICIFSDNFRTPLFKVYTRARYKQAKISQNKVDLEGFFCICGYILTPVSVICRKRKITVVWVRKYRDIFRSTASIIL